MNFMRRVLLGSFAVLGGLAFSAVQLKCQAEPFKLYNRLICPECLTASVDGQIEYGTNIDHYRPFKIIDWEGIIPEMRSLTIFGEDELAFALVACLREFGYRGEIDYRADTLPYRKREFIQRLKDPPESLIIRPRSFYNNYKVKLESIPKSEAEEARFPTPVFRHSPIFASLTIYSDVTPLPVVGATDSDRIHKLDDLQDFTKLQKRLKSAKSVHIVGGTPESIDLYYQLQKDFPQLSLSFSYDSMPKELAAYAPKNSLAGYSFRSLSKDTVNLSAANDFKTLSSDLVVFMHRHYHPKSKINPLNGNEKMLKLGTALKLFPNNHWYPTNNLENVHNVIMNALDKMTSFYYPNVEAFKFGGNKPVFLLGDFYHFDNKIEQNGLVYYFKNGLLIGAKGSDPRAISVLRYAIAVDCVPIYHDAATLASHQIQKEVEYELDKVGVHNRLKDQLPRTRVQHR